MDAEKRQHLESQLSAYLDGELTEAEAREVEAWLDRDADARVLRDALRATADAVSSLPRAEAGDAVLDGLRARMERRALLGRDAGLEPAPASEPWLLRARWVAAAAVIALTFTAGYLIWPSTRPEAETGPAGREYALEQRSDDQAKAPSDAGTRDTDEVMSLADAGKPRDADGLYAEGEAARAGRAPAAAPPAATNTPEPAILGGLAERRMNESTLDAPHARGLEQADGGLPALGYAANAVPATPATETPAEEPDQAGDEAREPEASAVVRSEFGALFDDRSDAMRRARVLEGRGVSESAAQAAGASILGDTPEVARVPVLELAFTDAATQERAAEVLRSNYGRGPEGKQGRAGGLLLGMGAGSAQTHLWSSLVDGVPLAWRRETGQKAGGPSSMAKGVRSSRLGEDLESAERAESVGKELEAASEPPPVLTPTEADDASRLYVPAVIEFSLQLAGDPPDLDALASTLQAQTSAVAARYAQPTELTVTTTGFYTAPSQHEPQNVITWNAQAQESHGEGYDPLGQLPTTPPDRAGEGSGQSADGLVISEDAKGERPSLSPHDLALGEPARVEPEARRRLAAAPPSQPADHRFLGNLESYALIPAPPAQADLGLYGIATRPAARGIVGGRGEHGAPASAPASGPGDDTLDAVIVGGVPAAGVLYYDYDSRLSGDETKEGLPRSDHWRDESAPHGSDRPASRPSASQPASAPWANVIRLRLVPAPSVASHPAP